MINIVTGLVFTLIITRQLSQSEFGTWSLIGGLIVYVLIIDPIVTFWATREIARGENSGKTAFLTSSVFSFGVIPVYFMIVILFVTQVDVDKEILLFAALLIPVRFLRHALAAINLGYKPQITSFALLIFTFSKIAFGLFFIYFLDMALHGVILAVFLSSIVSILYSFICSFDKIKGSFNPNLIKKWFKLFWLPLYPKISEALLASDVVIFTILVGSVNGLAYWAAAFTITVIIINSSKIAKAVYPKLLENNKKEILGENLVRVFYFAIPLTALTITLARPGLFMLNPIYEIAVPIVVILSIVIFLRALSGMFTFSLTGIERVDVKTNSTFKDYLKSKLFYLPTLQIIHRSSYLVSLAVMLVLFVSKTSSEIDLVIYWALIALATQIPYTIYLYFLVRKDFKAKINGFVIIKYLASAIFAFGITHLLIEEFLEYKISIFEFLPSLIPITIVGISLYLGITYLIDRKTRKLFKAVVNEIKK